MANGSQKKFNGTPKAKTRRTNVIARLESQLKKNIKSTKELGKMVLVPLDEKDTNRINKELTTLKTRI
jgi:L-lactate utilization protein LutB